MFFVYIIYSASKDKYYIGQTSDIENRLETHCVRKNLGASDWVLKYSETFATRSEAVKRESEIKNKKRRAYIESLISSTDSYPLDLKIQIN